MEFPEAEEVLKKQKEHVEIPGANSELKNQVGFPKVFKKD